MAMLTTSILGVLVKKGVFRVGGVWCSSMDYCSQVLEWEGLQRWRVSPVDENRLWGRNCADSGPAQHQQHCLANGSSSSSSPSSLAEWGALVLSTPDPATKASITHHAFTLWSQNLLPIGIASAPHRPARPSKPQLVPARQVPQGKSSPLPPNAHIMHNLAHVELNAIDLAWDTVVRFSSASEELDKQFFADFVHVADDESRHFGWCSQRLSELGFRYGDMPAHDMLLNDGERTSGNVIERLVVVPMVQEARGLDAGSRIAQRLVGMGDSRSAGIVSQIAEEEVAHVAVGVSWFMAICKKLEMKPDKAFKELLQKCKVELKGPYNHLARAKAGLPRHWYDPLDGFSEVSKKEYLDQNISEVKAKEVISAEHNASPQQDSNATSSRLPEVYERLSLLVAFEKENITT